MENGTINKPTNKKKIELSERELSHVVVALIVGALCIFLAGYFLGKKRMVEEVALIDETQFAQKMHAALSALGKNGTVSDDAETVGGGDDSEEDEEVTAANSSPKIAGPKMAFARLCGFGSRSAAEDYVARLAKRNIPVKIDERESVRRDGTAVQWYQVVTNTMDTESLARIVQVLKKEDKLRHVVVVEHTGAVKT